MAAPLSPATAELGARVRRRREELGLSQEAAARRGDFHWSFLGKFERGERNVGLHNLLKVAAALEIDPGDLVRGLLPPDDSVSATERRSD